MRRRVGAPFRAPACLSRAATLRVSLLLAAMVVAQEGGVAILEGRNAGRHNYKPCLHGLHPLPPPEPIKSVRAGFHVPGPGTHDPNPRVLSTSRVFLAQGSEAHVPADLRSATMGLPSEELAFEDTFFSPLYVHSMFGPLSPWAVSAHALRDESRGAGRFRLAIWHCVPC